MVQALWWLAVLARLGRHYQAPGRRGRRSAAAWSAGCGWACSIARRGARAPTVAAKLWFVMFGTDGWVRQGSLGASGHQRRLPMSQQSSLKSRGGLPPRPWHWWWPARLRPSTGRGLCLPGSRIDLGSRPRRRRQLRLRQRLDRTGGDALGHGAEPRDLRAGRGAGGRAGRHGLCRQRAGRAPGVPSRRRLLLGERARFRAVNSGLASRRHGWLDLRRGRADLHRQPGHPTRQAHEFDPLPLRADRRPVLAARPSPSTSPAFPQSGQPGCHKRAAQHLAWRERRGHHRAGGLQGAQWRRRPLFAGLLAGRQPALHSRR